MSVKGYQSADQLSGSGRDALTCLLQNDSSSYVSNVKTKCVAVESGSHRWPVTVNEREYENAIICSPYGIYVRYPWEKMREFEKLWIKALVVVHCTLLGSIFRIGKIDRALQLNNDLNSLLGHTKSLAKAIPELTRALIERYPGHAITLYRVNSLLDQELSQTLIDQGYRVFPDRIGHIFLPETGFIRRSHTKRDLKLLNRSRYEVVSHAALNESDAERLAELYRMLFVDKHSQLNPVYTAKYFRDALRGDWHTYVALRSPEGRIDGFISWYYRDKVMMCGPLGYNTEIDRKEGLYRQLVALCLRHADRENIPFNMGGGSDEFKSKRGSTQTIEQTAVYFKHLPFYRQVPWRLLAFATGIFLKRVLASVRL